MGETRFGVNHCNMVDTLVSRRWLRCNCDGVCVIHAVRSSCNPQYDYYKHWYTDSLDLHDFCYTWNVRSWLSMCFHTYTVWRIASIRRLSRTSLGLMTQRRQRWRRNEAFMDMGSVPYCMNAVEYLAWATIVPVVSRWRWCSTLASGSRQVVRWDAKKHSKDRESISSVWLADANLHVIDHLWETLIKYYTYCRPRSVS